MKKSAAVFANKNMSFRDMPAIRVFCHLRTCQVH